MTIKRSLFLICALTYMCGDAYAAPSTSNESLINAIKKNNAKAVEKALKD